jgi:PTH1 family peptidyl-tRNA hydrolase
MTLDLLAEWEKFKLKKLKFKSLTALASINGVKCFVMKPTTYMNLSGQAVVPAMEFYKIPPERTIIVYDDFSLPLGVVKIRRNGSDGGHNGMKSIILESDSDEFPRVKIGIGEPPHPKFPMKEWVTSHFRKDEGEKLELSLGRAAAAVSLMVKGDIEKAMNDFNANV